MSRVVVIGAGIGGLSAAARLAKLGHDVELFESAEFVGGKCRTRWIGDVAFDTGPSLLTLPAVYRDLFAATGDGLDTVLELTPVTPSFDYRFANGDSVEFANLSRHQTLLAIQEKFGPESAKEWQRLMLRAESMWDVSRQPFVESELTSLLSLARRPKFLRDMKVIAPWQSLRSLVSKTSGDKRLQYIVDRYATYSGSDPRKAPAVLLSIAFVEESFGAWHVTGGVGQLAIAIGNRAVDLGVKIHLNTHVSAIHHLDNEVTGVTLADGRYVSTDIVVANADATTVYSKLITEPIPSLRRPRRDLARTVPSLSGFSLYLTMKTSASLPSLRHHTILFPVDYDAEFDAIFDQAQPVERPTIYICAPQDQAMTRKADRQGWSILVNAPRHSATGQGFDWNTPGFAQKYAESILDHIEFQGIPVRENLIHMEIRTPADLESEVNAPGGSIYGNSSNGARSAFTRARNRSPLSGLFCVGGSAHPGGGLPLVGISAEIVARAIGKA